MTRQRQHGIAAAGSFYVRRISADGRLGWTGPIRSTHQAVRECDAWEDAGWRATLHASCPEIRAQVRAWERTVKAARAAR